MLPSENENITFHTFIMHSLNITCCINHGVNIKFIWEKTIDSHKVCSKCPPLPTGTKTSTYISAFAIDQLRYQSATAPSRATHAVDAVAAYRCHELWSHTRVAGWQTIAPDMWPPNSPDLNPVDYAIWSVIQLDAADNILRVHYKGMKYCDISFSLGSVSTLFRWGGHFCNVRVCVKHFFLVTVQKL